MIAYESVDRRISVHETPEGRAVLIEQMGPDAVWKPSQNIGLQGDEVAAVAEALKEVEE
jgi:hypothetical protein